MTRLSLSLLHSLFFRVRHNDGRRQSSKVTQTFLWIYSPSWVFPSQMQTLERIGGRTGLPVASVFYSAPTRITAVSARSVSCAGTPGTFHSSWSVNVVLLAGPFLNFKIILVPSVITFTPPLILQECERVEELQSKLHSYTQFGLPKMPQQLLFDRDSWEEEPNLEMEKSWKEILEKPEVDTNTHTCTSLCDCDCPWKPLQHMEEGLVVYSAHNNYIYEQPEYTVNIV